MTSPAHEPRTPDRGRTVVMRLALLAVWLLPLVVWPGLERPFSTPKLVLLAAASLAVALARMTGRGGTPGVPSRVLVVCVAAWVASFAVSSLLAPLPSLHDVAVGIAAPAFALAVLESGAARRQVVGAMAGTATVVACIALLQWARLDPLAAWGWHAPVDGLSVRMRVHATLGNPNFVGAFMAGSVPLAAVGIVSGRRWRVWAASVSAVLLIAALVATGSRGAVLGLAVAGLAWAAARASRRAVVAGAIVVVVGALAIWHSPARPLQTTLEGRVYLWQVVGRHGLERPVAGLGPGAVALRFPDWQREADAAGHRDIRFRGITDHVHNDYLEALVERGIIGLCTLIAPLACVVGTAMRRHPYPPLEVGALASVLALATCALVDFPLARPVELAWWWLAIGLVLTPDPSPAD